MRVVFATDRSPHAEDAAWLLCRLPTKEPINVRAVSVMPSQAFVMFDDDRPVIKQIIDRERQELEDSKDKLVEPFEGMNGHASVHIRSGNVTQEILQEANEQDSDLIVIGARGQGPLDRIVLGSTSDKVATHSPKSVLVARKTWLSRDNHPIHILVGVDGTEDDFKRIQFLSRFSWGPATEIHLVCCMSVSGLIIRDVTEKMKPEWQQTQRVLQAHLSKLKDSLSESAGNIVTETIDSTHVGADLVEYAQKHEIDLITVGDYGHGFFSRLTLGSVSRYVLHHAHCSVLIVR